MGPDPEPDNIYVLPISQCPVMIADVYRPDSALFGEVQRRVVVVFLEKFKFTICKILNRFGKSVAACPEIRMSERPQSHLMHLPAIKSDFT